MTVGRPSGYIVTLSFRRKSLFKTNTMMNGGGTHNGADHHEEKNDTDFVDDDFGDDDVSSPAPIMKSMNQNQVMEMVSHFNQNCYVINFYLQ